jgi:hypothetical protein
MGWLRILRFGILTLSIRFLYESLGLIYQRSEMGQLQVVKPSNEPDLGTKKSGSN